MRNENPQRFLILAEQLASTVHAIAYLEAAERAMVMQLSGRRARKRLAELAREAGQ